MQVINHHFIGGVYAKELVIPDGHEVVSHAHNFDHMSVLTNGCVIVEVGNEQETYWSPAVIEIKAGKYHSVTAVNGDAHWLCIHKTDCDDESKVDDVLIDKKLYMRQIPGRIDVTKINKQLDDNPQLWNKYRLRTTMYENSPHREVDDIWLRYRDWREFNLNKPDDFSSKHESVWYEASEKLNAVHTIVDQLKKSIGDFDLGGVLITKIPSGKQVYRHSDAGKWHSEYYETKVLVLLSSDKGQTFNFDHESHEGETGDVFLFDNAPYHSVVNNSSTDRVSLILAIKRK